MTDSDESRPSPTPPVVASRAKLATQGRRFLGYAIIFVTLALVVDVIAGEKGWLALLKARREYAALEQSLESTRTENADLREKARRLDEDPNAVEEQARRELGYIKPGELLFIIKDIDHP